MFTEQPKALGQEIGAIIVTSTASAQVAGATRAIIAKTLARQ